MNNMRTEQDSLGKVQIPKDAYYGTTTARAKRNFQISNIRCSCVFMEALGLVKLAAAQTNASLKLLDPKISKAIEQACREFIDCKYRDEFDLDVFQAGAGTSYNMNANEVIANRANELLGAAKGSYKFVHPNNHVNMGQSTNDVIPTATRIAALLILPSLLSEIKQLEDEFSSLSKKYAKVTKVGRTHLQDAVPITFKQVFDAYNEAIKKSREFIADQGEKLQILGIGGTAVGTGLNAHPRYKTLMIKNLSNLIGIEFKSAENLTEMANNMTTFLNFSGALRSLCTNLLNICSDIKLMNSGPKAGLDEITIPAVQPGSSIMPGKINPSIPEALEMICMQILGNDRTIEIAAQKSNFELNTNCPIIMYNLLQSMKILTNGCRSFREFCVSGIKVNETSVKKTFDNSLATATALAPKLGYAATAELVKSALKNGTTLEEELKKRR